VAKTVGDLRDAGLIHDSSQFDGQSGSGLESDFLSGDEYVEISSGNGFDGVYESGDDAGISDLGRDGVTDLVSLNEDGSLSFHNISKVDGNKVTTTDMITGESNGTYEIASDDGGTISGDTTAPDGSTVVFSPMYRATEPDKKNLSKAVSVETGMTNEHTHIATVNAEGDGKTNEVLGHTHEIVDWGVLEAGDPPHTHTLEKPAELTDQTPSESPADATPSEMPTEGQGMKGLPVSLNKAIGKKKTRWNISLSKVFDIENNPSVTSEAVFKLYCNYLECKVKDMFIQMESIPSTMLGNVLHAYKMVLGKYQLRDTRAYGWKGDEMPPVSEVIQLNSKEQDDFLVYGSQFYDNKGTGLIVEVSPDWMGVRMRFISNSKDKEWVKSVVNEAKKYAKENNKLKGEMFALSGEFLSKTEDRFNDLILDENTKRAVMNVSSQINKKGAEFKSRGMILLGPPGTGKTKTCRAFMNETNASLIWVSSKDLDRIGATRGLSLAFSVAREIAPAVILFEDIDGWIKGYGTDLLKTELDGLKQQNAVLTVLTSNHPEELPDALIDRPGRFHDVLEFDLPTKDLRSEMLIKWLGDSMSEIDETKFNTIIAETEGMSGAHLKELVDFARVLSEEEQVAIDDAVIKSLVKLKKQRELIQTVKEKQFGAILKEGRVISTKNAAVINNAITAQKNSIEVLEKLLEEAQPTADTSADTQKGFSKNGSSVKGRAELHKLKEQKSNRQITSDDIALRVLKQIAGQSSLALSKLNK
jgi:hypothetical protein